ncbi:MAG: DEAD/DEAH box helicase family protein [Desulfovibrio sp.]|jgi:superfamily II DNA or RNA helicase|nr:DEAD/DEAH box helicase family protein [Desulfovibrio sp.]
MSEEENHGITGKFAEGSPKLKRLKFTNSFEYTTNLPGQPYDFWLSGQVCKKVLVARDDSITNFLNSYGQVIVDECHHISAFSFESVLKQAKSKYVVGLTATPIRRDGHHPIIFMQCGALRHIAPMPKGSVSSFEVHPKFSECPTLPDDSGIQKIFSAIIASEARNRSIIADVLSAYKEGRKILLLTERTEHLLCLNTLFGKEIEHSFVLHGRLPKKQRLATLQAIEELGVNEPRLLLATGKLIGEGFDHSPLDTMFLTMPISWKGTLQQYAGRLHREHAGKHDVRIYDYVETGNVILQRMWEKRLKGYIRLGYVVRDLEQNAQK